MSSKTTFSCGNSLDITHVSALYHRLERSLQKSNVIELKAEGVEKVDTAGLQLMISVKNEVEASSGSIRWKKPSEKLINAAKSLGLLNHLGLAE